MLAKFREALAPSGKKDDPADAQLLLELVSKHQAKLKPWRPADEHTRTLQFFVEHRRKLVQDKTRLTNRLTSVLKGYFPQVLCWFAALDTPLVCDFLKQWPTLEAVQSTDDTVLRTFFQAHHAHNPAINQQRLDGIRHAIPATTDQAVIRSSVMVVHALVEQVRCLAEAIRRFEQEIEGLTRAHADFPIFASLPGAGPVHASRLISALGTDWSRYECVDDLLTFAGIAPIIERSGKTIVTHFRWFCPKFLRQSFHEFPGSPFNTPSGRKRSIDNNACVARITKQRYDLWPLSGPELSFKCGSVGHRITSEPIWPRYNDAARHCVKCWLNTQHRRNSRKNCSLVVAESSSDGFTPVRSGAGSSSLTSPRNSTTFASMTLYEEGRSMEASAGNPVSRWARLWARLSDPDRPPRRWWFPPSSRRDDVSPIPEAARQEYQQVVREAHEKFSETIRLAMLSLLGFALFCLLITFSTPDSALLVADPTVKMPFADVQVSFQSFIILAPLLLIIITLYLHIFYGYWLDLETDLQHLTLSRESSKLSIARLPILFSLDHWVPRLLAAFIFYWLVPLVLLAMTWKAAARVEWGAPLVLCTGLVTVALVFLQIRRRPASQRQRNRLLWVVMGLIVGGIVAITVPFMAQLPYRQMARAKEIWDIQEPLRDIVVVPQWLPRPLNIFRADLKGRWLAMANLRDAFAGLANLQGAFLLVTDLRGAELFGANLQDAHFVFVDLRGADLQGADLQGAHFRWTDLQDAHLRGANLQGANLRGANLRGASLWGADLKGVQLQKARELTVDQLSIVKTLYQARLDPPVLEQIQQRYPHLLEEPQD